MPFRVEEQLIEMKDIGPMAAMTDLFTLKPKAAVRSAEPAPAKSRVKAPAPDVKRVSKAAAAYRTISEVAAELGVATHVLRFWESKFPVIRPLKKSGGRRYYKPEDIALLRHIQDLLYHQGYTIKGVQAHLAKAKKRDLQQAVEQMLTPAQLAQEVRAIRDMLAGDAAPADRLVADA